MIDKRLMADLKSKDATQRGKAVMSLAQSLDRDALPHLAEVAKSDEDKDVRLLANKAMKYIRQKAPAAHKTNDDLLDEREPEASLIEQALDAYVGGDYNTAQSRLLAAFKANPRLADDEDARQTAAQITGLSPHEAVASIKASLKSGAGRRRRSLLRPGMLSVLALIIVMVGGAVTAWGGLQPWLVVDGVNSYNTMDIASDQNSIAQRLSSSEDSNLTEIGINRSLLSYSMYLVVLGGILQIGIAAFALGGQNIIHWLGMLIIIVAVGVAMYWFNDAFNLLGGAAPGGFAPGANLITGDGFVLTQVGLAIMVGGGALGMLTSAFMK